MLEKEELVYSARRKVNLGIVRCNRQRCKVNCPCSARTVLRQLPWYSLGYHCQKVAELGKQGTRYFVQRHQDLSFFARMLFNECQYA